jgi:hypothetical protein
MTGGVGTVDNPEVNQLEETGETPENKETTDTDEHLTVI